MYVTDRLLFRWSDLLEVGVGFGDGLWSLSVHRAAPLEVLDEDERERCAGAGSQQLSRDVNIIDENLCTV